MGGTNEKQIGGDHYKKMAIQPWDYIAANDLGFFEGNIVKYVTRWRKKQNLDDLRKAQHYLEKLIELHTLPLAVSVQGSKTPYDPNQGEPI